MRRTNPVSFRSRKSEGASDKIFERIRILFWNFEAPTTIFVNKNTPELSVSGTNLTILKIWTKNIEFGKSYGEYKHRNEISEMSTKNKYLNKNTPEFSVSGIDLTILKIWTKNIEFEKSYGEYKHKIDYENQETQSSAVTPGRATFKGILRF